MSVGGLHPPYQGLPGPLWNAANSCGLVLAQACQVGQYRPVFPIEDAMRCQAGEGSTPVLLESRCSRSANLATWAAVGPADSGEPGTCVAGDTHDSPRHREVVPEVGPSAPRAGAGLTPPASALPRLEEMSLVPELPPRVLVAEDNSDLQPIFARQLNLLGLEVVGVSNGRDAVDFVLAAYEAGNPFDLVLMDLEMPIVDGYEATRRIRAGGFSGPILALTHTRATIIVWIASRWAVTIASANPSTGFSLPI